MTKTERVQQCNRAIAVIASVGRRFFSQDADQTRMERPRVSRFELDERGRIWFVDRWNGERIYVAYKYWGREFSEGGTLRSLVCAMRDYVRDERNTIPFGHFGPWPQTICDGDLWGYGKDMTEVRRRISDIFNEEPGK